MQTESKVALGVGAALLALGLPYILKLKRLSEELETSTAVNIHNVTLLGIKLRVDVTLKNPTGATLRVKHPFVRMVFRETVFASSDMVNKDYELPKFGQHQLDPIYVDLSFVQLGMQVPDLLKEYRKSGKLELMVKTVTTINNNIPYTKSDNITL